MRVLPFLLILAAPALAAQRVVLAPIAGDKTHALQKQLSAALCDTFDCVESSKVMHGAKPDWKKARRAGVDGVLSGKVLGKKLELEMVLTSEPRQPAFTKTFILMKGRLSKKDVSKVTAGLTGALGESAPALEASPPQMAAPPSEPTPTPVPEESPSPPVVQTPPREETSEQPTAPTRRSTRRSTEVEAPTEQQTSGTAIAPLVLADVGIDMVGRSFGYDTLTAGNALAYQASFIPSPRIDLELYPLARAVEGIPQRLGLSFTGAFSVGLKSELGTLPSHPTSLTRLDFGALSWFGPRGGWAVAPEVGFRIFNFSTSPASDGSALAGLPNVNYQSLRFSAGGRFPLNDTVKAELRLSALPVLNANQLISSQYFSKGSGFGLEGEVGLRVMLATHIGFALFGEYTRYGFSFTSASTDTYQAKGATDQVFGGRGELTFTY